MSSAIDTPTTAEVWATRICAQFAKSVASVIEVGRLLVAAKDTLPYGEFGRLFEDRLVQFTHGTAERLMKIARHPVLSDSAFMPILPPSWATLYELSQVPQPQLLAALENGSITPQSTGLSVRRLFATPTPPTPKLAVTVLPARSRQARADRLVVMRQLAADGASVPQIAAAVHLGEEQCRILLRREAIAVPADRVVKGRKRLDSTRILEQTVCDAEDVTADLRLVDWTTVDPAALRGWLRRLRKARKDLNRFMQRLLTEERSHAYAAGETSQAPVSNLSGDTRADAGSASPGDAA